MRLCTVGAVRSAASPARKASFSTFSLVRDNATTTSASFSTLALPTPVLSALQKAFPHVQHPTPSQAALLSALIPPIQRRTPENRNASGRSLILRDVTGSGKSLALLIGLLSQAMTREQGLTRKSQRTGIKQLLLVPHTEVARQYEYWLDLLRAAAGNEQPALKTSQPDSPAGTPFNVQVAYRGQAASSVKASSIDFLISTPSAFLEQLPSLNLSGLHTVALDEADSMLSLPGRFSTHQDLRKWERHPPLLMSIMQELLTEAQPTPTKASPGKVSRSTKRDVARETEAGLRIIAVSATANSVFRDWLVRRSGWIGTKGILGERQIDWYDFSGGEGDQLTEAGKSVYEEVGKGLLPNAEVQHLLYRVDEEGELQNKATLTDADGTTAPTSSNSKGKIDLEPAFLALSTIFALDEVVSGLVLIPSSQSLPKTLDYFHSLSIPATTLSEAQDLPADEPRLYVVSVDAVRGLDIPNLSHVFILPGTVEDSSSYLHIAGRVGRLGDGGKRKKGKVISLVRSVVEKDERRIRRYWELLGIEGACGPAMQE